jgi:hypothetical protein
VSPLNRTATTATLPHRRLRAVFLTLVLTGLLAGSQLAAQTPYATARPWTYWWWLGSAVDRPNIERQLTAFAAAGLGGVHIIPIYGVRGYEDRFLPFLSGAWLDELDFTLRTAQRLGLGVDLTLGTGWPYGGPWVEPEHAARQLSWERHPVGTTDSLVLDTAQLRARYRWDKLVAAYATNGTDTLALPLDDGPTVRPVAAADWQLLLFGSRPTGQQVKRAAPGGAGPVLDYFQPAATASYLAHFDSTLQRRNFTIRPRAVYHDSYEAYHADWTPQFFRHFREQRGYALRDYLPLLADTTHPDHPLLRHDIRATLAEQLRAAFAERWTGWASQRSYATRYQAHGSPGNLLDLYGLATIPETESFGCSVFPIPGLSCDPDYDPARFGRPSPLLMKLASSPAHLLGKPLVSAETGTWLGNHFKVALRELKPQLDELFVSGINHVFYHGIPYSPAEAGYPGWRFYAATHFGPTAHFWDELPLLNEYITTCQAPLQTAQPDHDILLYFPIHDLWTHFPGDPLLLLDVHHYRKWFSATPFGQTADWLWRAGYAFDYVSDRQLADLRIDRTGQIRTAGGATYRTIVVPRTDYLPAPTLQHLARLAGQGIPVIFRDQLPQAFPGLRPNQAPQRPRPHPRFRVTDDLGVTLEEAAIRRETLKSQGLDFLRKQNEAGTLYFITNLGDEFYADSVRLAADYRYVTIRDPLTQRSGYIRTSDRFWLNLPPGQSCLLQTTRRRPTGLPPWMTFQPRDTLPLPGPWTVRFAGATEHGLAASYRIDSLTSWTEWGDSSLLTYTGKATYTTRFRLEEPPGAGEQLVLRIDGVRETAAVTVNGVACGTIWSFPNELILPAHLLGTDNRLEIVVQNLGANYIKAYDARHPEWKRFYDINFVDITYQPFDPAGWPPEPAGLIGPAELVVRKGED